MSESSLASSPRRCSTCSPRGLVVLPATSLTSATVPPHFTPSSAHSNPKNLQDICSYTLWLYCCCLMLGSSPGPASMLWT